MYWLCRNCIVLARQLPGTVNHSLEAMFVLNTKSQPRVSVARDTIILRWSSLLQSSLGVALAGLVLSAGQAKALVVNVDGLSYEVTTFIGGYNDNIGKFSVNTDMPWWNDSGKAKLFARAVGFGLGLPNASWVDPGYIPSTGSIAHPGLPFFGLSMDPNNPNLSALSSCVLPTACSVDALTWDYINDSYRAFTLARDRTYLAGSDYSDVIVWAQATLVTPPATPPATTPATPPASTGGSGGTASVPGPLPILGLAAAFGFSRKLRKRIKLHKGTSDISVSTGA